MEWARYAQDDASAVAIAEDLHARAATLLGDLKAIVACAGPCGERDCVIELRSQTAQISGYQASELHKFANVLGLEVNFLAVEEHLCILEVKGWLAMGHFAHLDRKTHAVQRMAWCNDLKIFDEITITVYPLWKDRELEIDHLDGLRWDTLREHGFCCFCSRNPKNGVRLHHATSGIKIELEGYEKEHYLRQKAMQLLKSQLRYRRLLQANNGC